MDNNEQQFTKGFNHGYLMEKYTPSLLKKIIKSINPSSEYFQGFFSGKRKYEVEKNKYHEDDLIKLRKSVKGRDIGIEK